MSWKSLPPVVFEGRDVTMTRSKRRRWVSVPALKPFLQGAYA